MARRERERHTHIKTEKRGGGRDSDIFRLHLLAVPFDFDHQQDLLLSERYKNGMKCDEKDRKVYSKWSSKNKPRLFHPTRRKPANQLFVFIPQDF